MRIISGKYKGKKILFPDKSITRPLRDRVKESIFNILQHSNKIQFEFKNSIVLDLFSGSGSFGLECLSRDAKKIFFFFLQCRLKFLRFELAECSEDFMQRMAHNSELTEAGLEIIL